MMPYKPEGIEFDISVLLIGHKNLRIPLVQASS